MPDLTRSIWIMLKGTSRRHSDRATLALKWSCVAPISPILFVGPSPTGAKCPLHGRLNPRFLPLSHFLLINSVFQVMHELLKVLTVTSGFFFLLLTLDWLLVLTASCLQFLSLCSLWFKVLLLCRTVLLLSIVLH